MNGGDPLGAASGLLGSVGRICPHGHGAMTPIPGMFALPQVVENLKGWLGPGNLSHNGMLFTVNLYVCPTCNTVELVNAPAKLG